MALFNTLISWSVLLDDRGLASLRAGAAAAQDPCPVDSVMVAELLVSCDVNAAVAYLSQGT